MHVNLEIDFPVLKEQSQKLLNYVCNFLEKRFEYDTDDHFGFMLMCFISKQREHLESVLQLVESHSFSDAAIIARNMLEGMVIINWVNEDKLKRALRWKKYCLITDYRLSLKACNGNLGLIDPNILSRVRSEGKEYLCERYKKEKVQPINLPTDPYKQYWIFDDQGKELKPYDLFKRGYSDIYGIYDEISNEIHWSVSSIGQRVKSEPGVVAFINQRRERDV